VSLSSRPKAALGSVQEINSRTAKTIAAPPRTTGSRLVIDAA
jgi:hypothetical protein